MRGSPRKLQVPKLLSPLQTWPLLVAAICLSKNLVKCLVQQVDHLREVVVPLLELIFGLHRARGVAVLQPHYFIVNAQALVPKAGFLVEGVRAVSCLYKMCMAIDD